jgi:hypothetical protein
VVVAADREERVHVDHSAALADLERRRCGQERVRALIERAGAEGVSLLVQLLDHDADL